MPIPEDQNFVYFPAAEGREGGTIYSLAKSDHIPQQGFAVIPYADPQKEIVSPLYFEITKHMAHINPGSTTAPSQIKIKSGTSKEQYKRQVRHLKEEIQRGNIYEINYCIEFFAENVEIDPWQIFARLQEQAQAPYAMMVKLDKDYILCASPELFLKKEGSQLISKPIKGTAKRGINEEEDKLLKEALYTSLKERTENVMAVDVARNDLSMLATKGSVKVNKLYNIESFKTVHQMVSTVSCELKNASDLKQVLNASFPMASMTGAPKLRAMQLIGETENFQRKYYSGAIGMFNNNDYELCVVIRSIFYNSEKKRVSFAVGGAITYLCDPEKEYEECLLKAGGMLRALNAKI